MSERKLREARDIIDGLEVITTQLPLRESLQLQHRLARIIVPAMAKLDDSVSLLSLLAGEDLSKIGPALETALGSVNENELWPLLCRVLAATQVKAPGDSGFVELNQPAKIEKVVFDPSTLYKLVWFAIKLNYGSAFFGAFSEPALGAMSATAPAEPEAAASR